MAAVPRVVSLVLRPAFGVPALIYVLLCAGMWMSPLLGLLHVESSMVVAAVAFFVGGLTALLLFQREEPLKNVFFGQLALLVIPWLMLTISLFWIPNCGYLQGLLLFLTYTIPSVVLGVALAFTLTPLGRLKGILWFVGIGLIVATIPIAYDFLFHPQFYSYNHVWGGLLGPLYDEELSIRPGLFFFRGLTIWWAIWLVALGWRIRSKQDAEISDKSRFATVLLLGASLVIGGIYVAAPWIGINTTTRIIQNELGGHLALDRFDIYYDPDSIPDGVLQRIADEHGYRYHQIREELGIDVPVRIATYLYPDADTKGRLTGSRTTSIVPIWLRTPQIHLLESRFESSFAHELVHIFSREFGLPIIKASLSIGLLEGLAVALEPPKGVSAPHDQVGAAFHQRDSLDVYSETLADAVAAKMSPSGFWRGRGAVSYTTMGSFVRYLLDAHGAEKFIEVYARGSFERVYGKSVNVLATDWADFIERRPIDESALGLVRARFSVPSLFEVRCPHHVPRAVRLLRRAVAAREAGDWDQAGTYVDRALRVGANRIDVLSAWSVHQFGLGNEEEVLARLEVYAAERSGEISPIVTVRMADAHRLLGNDVLADSLYALAIDRYSRTTRAEIQARSVLGEDELRILTSHRLPEERARALEQTEQGLAIAAMLWAQIHEYDRADEVMERGAGLLEPGPRLAMQSAWAYNGGYRARAGTLAEAAAATYDVAEDPLVATYLRDRAAMIWWSIFHRDDPEIDDE